MLRRASLRLSLLLLLALALLPPARAQQAPSLSSREQAQARFLLEFINERDAAARALRLKEGRELLDRPLVRDLARLAVQKAAEGGGPLSLVVADRAVELAEALEDPLARAFVRVQRAEVRTRLGRAPDAVGDLREALDLLRKTDERGGVADALNGLGNTLRLLGRFSEAMGAYDEALAIARELKQPLAVGYLLSGRGNVLMDQGRLPEAAVAQEEALAIARAEKDAALTDIARYNLSSVWLLQGRYREGAEVVAALLKDLPPGSHRAIDAGINLGHAETMLGRYREARQRLETARDAAKKAGDPILEGRALLNLGNLHYYSSDFPAALDAYRAAEKGLGAAGEGKSSRLSRANVGNVHLWSGRYAEALRLFEESRAGAARAGDRQAEALAVNNIAMVHLLAGRFEAAESGFLQAEKLAESAGDVPLRTIARDNRARAWLQMGRLEESAALHAETAAEKARLGDLLGEAGALQGRGNALIRLSRWEEARQVYARSRELAVRLDNPFMETQASLGEGLCEMRLFRLEQGALLLERARETADRLGHVPNQVQTYNALGHIWYALRAWRRSADAFGRSLDLVETVRSRAGERSLQSGFFSLWADTYAELAGSHVHLGDLPSAFAAAERARARAIVDAMDRSRFQPTRGMSAEQRRQEADLSGRLSLLSSRLESAVTTDEREALGAELKRARAEWEQFRVRLYVERPRLAFGRARFQPAALDRIGRVLQSRAPGTAVLSYLCADDETYLFVLLPGGAGKPARLSLRRLPVKARDLEARAQEFWSLCAQPGSRWQGPAAALYRLLVAPAEREITGRTALVVVPDGPLQNLPFAALLDGRGRPLGERYDLSDAPSVTAWVQMLEQAPRAPASGSLSLLAVGDCRFSGRFSPLPATRKEVEAVSRAAAPRARALLTGEAATETAVRARLPRARVVHLATHGVLNPHSPMYSAVVLARGPGDDGLLEAREIADLELNANLVVLSACETALGRQVSGEGILGLAWSLYVAGARSVVASDWQVGDESTAALMAAFYRVMARPGATRAGSLRLARRAIRTAAGGKWAHPYYWAAFRLGGVGL